jgi:quercetin dioxygenase-like cupin family protein
MKGMWARGVVLLIASSLGVMLGAPSLAQEKAKKDPVRFVVVNTFEPGFPGIEKAQLIQFEMDPGAAVKDFKVASTEILWVTKGTFKYKYGDRTVEKKTGESWLHQEGIVLDVANTGKDVAILRGIQFLKKK